MELSRDSSVSSSQSTEQSEDSFSCSRDSDRFSRWFSIDGLSRGSVTWPEEKLPLWVVPGTEHDHQQRVPNQVHSRKVPPESWGLVIVTACSDGMIRTFHNYGLPVRLEES